MRDFLRRSNWPLAFALGALVATIAVAAVQTVSPIQVTSCSAGQFISAVNADGSVSCAASGSGGGEFNQVMSATPTHTLTGFGASINLNSGGSATTGDGTTGQYLDLPAGQTGDNIRGITQTAPGTPYTLTLLLALTAPLDTQNPTCQIGFYDGTKLEDWAIAGTTLNTEGQTAQGLQRWSSVSSFSAWYSNLTGGHTGPIGATGRRQWIQINNDGTNVTYRISDDGAKFIDEASIVIGTAFLANYNTLFFGVNDSSGGYGAHCTIMSWS